MPNILIIYASFGQGHKQAALALSSHLKVPCYDLLDFTLPPAKKLFAGAYLLMAKKYPFLWDFLYKAAKNKPAKIAIKAVHILIYFPLIKYLKKIKPDIVISTHFFSPPVIGVVKEKLGFKQFTIVTDIEPHPMWASPGVDFFFVPAAQTKKWLIDFGISKNKIIDGCIAIREGFLKETPKSGLYEKLNLNPNKKTLLFLSSSEGNIKFLPETAKELSEKFNLIVIYGKNINLKKYLKKANLEDVKTFSFYQNMWELMSLASLIITKPGGLTVFEGIYKKKLFIFTHFIPGQEEENMHLLIRYGLAKIAAGPRELTASIEELLKKENQFQKNYPLEFKDIRGPLARVIELCQKSPK